MLPGNELQLLPVTSTSQGARRATDKMADIGQSLGEQCTGDILRAGVGALLGFCGEQLICPLAMGSMGAREPLLLRVEEGGSL